MKKVPLLFVKRSGTFSLNMQCFRKKEAVLFTKRSGSFI